MKNVFRATLLILILLYSTGVNVFSQSDDNPAVKKVDVTEENAATETKDNVLSVEKEIPSEEEHPSVTENAENIEDDLFDSMMNGDFLDAFNGYFELLDKFSIDIVSEYYYYKIKECCQYAEGGLDLRFRQVLDRLSSNADLYPTTKALVMMDLMEYKIKKGKLDEATKITDDLGYIKNWLVIAPFDNGAEIGHNEVYEPETEEINLDKEYKSKFGVSKWTTLKIKPKYGCMKLKNMFRYSQYITAYLCTFVEMEEASNISFYFGSTGPVKLFVNNELVYDLDVYRKYNYDQNAVLVHLNKGVNKIIFKVSNKTSDFLFSVRTANESGFPINLNFNNDLDYVRKIIADKSIHTYNSIDEDLNAPLNYVQVLKDKIDKNEDDSESQIKLAFLSYFKSLLDENDKSLIDMMKKIVDEYPEYPQPSYYLSLVSNDRNESLNEAKKLLESYDKSPFVNHLLSQYYSIGMDDYTLGNFFSFYFAPSVDRTEGEEQTVSKNFNIPYKEKYYNKKALELNPDFIPALIAKYNLIAKKHKIWSIEADKIINKIDKLMPNSKLVANYVYQKLEYKPRQLYIDYCKNYLKEYDFSDQYYIRNIIYFAKKMSKYDEVIKYHMIFNELYPYDFSYDYALADYLLGLEKYDGAIDVLKNDLSKAPENTEILQKLGECYVIKGDTNNAILAWEKIIKLIPNNPELKKRIRNLKNTETKFWKDLVEDLKPYIDNALKNNNYPKKIPKSCVLKNDIVKINKNGTGAIYQQRVYKVLTEKGVNDCKAMYLDVGEGAFYYSDSEVKRAELIKPNGEIEEGDWYQGSSYVRFENIKIGDVIVLEVKTEEQGPPRYKGYIGLLLMMQDFFTMTEKSIVKVILPEEKELYFKLSGYENAEFKEGSVDKIKYRQWTISGLDQIEEQDFMPYYLEIIPYIHISTFKDWNDIAVWYSHLSDGQFELNDEIKQKVNGIINDKMSRKEKIKEIYKFVVSEIRYEAVSLSNHGYKPFKAYQTYAKKYGDCKDTACLFVSIMKYLGIQAYFTLVRTNDMGTIDITIPSMQLFNHAIAYVPDIDGKNTPRFFDLTARYCGALEIPQMDETAFCYVMDIDKQKGEPKIIPMTKPSENEQIYNFNGTIDEEGNLTAVLQYTLIGKTAGYFRGQFQKGTKQKDNLEKYLNNFFGNAKIINFEISDISDYNMPVNVKINFQVNKFSTVKNKQINFTPIVFKNKLAQYFCETEERYHDLVLRYPYYCAQNIKNTMKFTVPNGYYMTTAPDNVDLKCNAWEYKSDSNYKDNVLIINTDFQQNYFKIPVSEYKEFREKAVQIERFEKREVKFEK